MKELYEGLKALVLTPQSGGAPVIKHVSMWNNQVNRLRESHPNQLDFQKPAVFFKFLPGECQDVGGGVQVYPNFQIEVHYVQEFINALDGGTELDLRLFDVPKIGHIALQAKTIKGADCGTGPLSRTNTEIDADHDNINDHIDTYTTSWTDNSTRLPTGGYEIDPPLEADITLEKLPLVTSPEVTASVSDIEFDDTAAGGSDTQTFTISAENAADPVIISVSSSIFSLSLNNMTFKSRIVLTPVDDTVTSTTVYVKFSPLAAEAYTGSINYGVPGLNSEITLTGQGT